MLETQCMPSAATLAAQIKTLAHGLGFNAVGIANTELARDEALLERWLHKGFHGEMGYLERHGSKRSRPAELVPGTISVICVLLNYLPKAADMQENLTNSSKAYIARYALGRDYHKVMRGRLRRLAQQVTEIIGPFGHRVFCDSAPVLEKALARNAGLGWLGKHTNLIDRQQGSWFFLGEIYTDLPLPPDSPHTADYCGSCTRCIEVCPTQAIVAPYVLDARRCIAYLTIELKGTIPEPLRPLIGNRIFGCDDCQLFCPWNRHAAHSAEPDFAVRHRLDEKDLLVLWNWSETEFLHATEGSALRRIGFAQWRRNLAVALGNAPPSPTVVEALRAARSDSPPMIAEHIDWALARHAA